MPSNRDRISMSADEVDDFLASQTTVIVATNGTRGWPHLMPLWYALRRTGPHGATELWAWTFGRSQKVKNIERDPRATLQIETGSEYRELRGVMLEAEIELVRDEVAVAAVGLEILSRATLGPPDPSADLHATVRAQAPKRVALRFVEQRRASWDHRKLPCRPSTPEDP
jgi:general stress protein 26